ncbi:MAG: hypothetical protein CSA81_00720 [Acidobacteria bacterium]|nr:MAG: hypothetical protein CSA81_00720 [Acidobacteriota bacterium]PIE89186.1 MAG: hypothetical protein CR997_12500 [Acidobacteriota bacterium]
MRKIILILLPLCVFAQRDYSNSPKFGFFEISVGKHVIDKENAIFEFSEETLTFNSDDLDGLDLSAGMYWQRSNYLSYGVTFQQYSESSGSEDRDYIYPDGSPILQTTELETTWFGFSMLVTPFGAGDFYGSTAWAPKSIVPYLKLGLGVVDWEFAQYGDFVDYQTETIYYEDYLTSGSTPGLQAGMGVRVKVTPKMDFNLNYSYTLAEDDFDNGDFSGFGDLDLSSKSASIGLTIKFF